MERLKKVVVIGGGTGNFGVLSGLKKYPIDLSAIVSMSDSGGHSGKLRDELGVLPPGDVRGCLVALADDDKAKMVRDLFNYRFEQGSQRGVSMGNLLITALSDLLGGFDKGVKAAHTLLDLKGRVIPVSLEKAHLLAELVDGTILFGETSIDIPEAENRAKISRVWLQPRVKTNPEAVKAVREADAIIFGPGDLYTSIMPNLYTKGLVEAIEKSKAALIGNINIMTKHGETDGFAVPDFVEVLEKILPRSLDHVVYNTKRISPAILRRYKKEKAYPVDVHGAKKEWVGTDLVSTEDDRIRHHPDKIAGVIARILEL